MSPDKPHEVTDEELLANAIPIDTGDELEELTGAPASPSEAPVPDAIDLVTDEDSSAPREIKMFGGRSRQAKEWKRQPNTTGTGATHVRTFVAKLRLDAVENLDNQVNQWLDEHPEFEVKFVTVHIGELKGKITEDALFMSVWV